MARRAAPPQAAKQARLTVYLAANRRSGCVPAEPYPPSQLSQAARSCPFANPFPVPHRIFTVLIAQTFPVLIAPRQRFLHGLVVKMRPQARGYGSSPWVESIKGRFVGTGVPRLPDFALTVRPKIGATAFLFRKRDLALNQPHRNVRNSP